MSSLEGMSLKVRQFKCFGDEPQGFDEIKRFNIIIGRNNSGKSSLLDLLEFATKDKGAIPSVMHRGTTDGPRILVNAQVTKNAVKRVFGGGDESGIFRGSDFGGAQELTGTRMIWEIDGELKHSFISVDDCENGPSPLDRVEDTRWRGLLVNVMSSVLRDVTYRRIFAERDIVPEQDYAKDKPDVDRSGTGATSLVQQFMTESHLRDELVEEALLSHLNVIFGPDICFDRVLCQRTQGTYEIMLEEKNKGRIRLSQSGSGLKTVMLVLLHTFCTLGDHAARAIRSWKSLRNLCLCGVLGRAVRNCFCSIYREIERRPSAWEGRRAGLSQGRLLRSVSFDLSISQQHNSTNV